MKAERGFGRRQPCAGCCGGTRSSTSIISSLPSMDIRRWTWASLTLSPRNPKEPNGLCTCGSHEICIGARGNIYPCPRLYGHPSVPTLGNCATIDPAAPLNVSRPAPSPDSECAGCWAYDWCGGGCSFQCQKCALMPSGRSTVTQRLWCDLMRARFARAAVTYRLLQQSYPKCLESIQMLFSDGSVA